MAIINAKFTTEWAGGNALTEPCRVNTETKEVFGVAPVPLGAIRGGVVVSETVTIKGKEYPVTPDGGSGYWYK